MRAVLERDYVAEAVRPRAFLARAAVGAAGAAVLLVLAVGAGALGGRDWDRVGGDAFAATTKALFVFLCATTPLLVVGSLLAERQGSTLEILLTTPEGAMGAAGGKFLARTGTVLGWLAAALPPLTVAVLFGGTSWRTLANTALALLGTVLELGAWALVVSALVRKPATAAVLAYLLPGAHWWAAGFLQHEAAASVPVALVASTAPFASLDLGAWDALLAAPAAAGAAGLLRHPGLAYVLFAALAAAAAIPLAAAALRREEAGARSLVRRIPRSPADGRLRARLTGGNPVAWKESLLQDTAWSRFLYYLVIGLLLAGEIATAVLLRRGEWTSAMDCGYLAFVAVAVMAMASLQGAASMSMEKAGGAFEILRATPLTPGEIARGKILGTLLGMGFLLLVPAAHLAVTTVAGIHHPAASAAGLLALLLLTANAAVHGLTWGAVARTPASALVGGASLVIFAFAGWWGLCFLPFLLAGMRLLRRDDTSDFFEIIVVPAALCGSPWLLFTNLLPAIDGMEAGGRGVAVAGWGMLSGVSLTLCATYLVYRARRLPEVLAREMARMSEGGDPRSPYPRYGIEAFAARRTARGGGAP